MSGKVVHFEIPFDELGEMAVLERQDVGDMGWPAHFKDLEGNLMGLWQARQS